ncbi:MAG: hypothetical protein EAZ65_09215 [Verrucomicrobia bacterium]|nr:MAG: hypothetical protein EAZ65_09215 [Verrucomicrobiota bacterium]
MGEERGDGAGASSAGPAVRLKANSRMREKSLFRAGAAGKESNDSVARRASVPKVRASKS